MPLTKSPDSQPQPKRDYHPTLRDSRPRHVSELVVMMEDTTLSPESILLWKMLPQRSQANVMFSFSGAAIVSDRLEPSK